MEVLVASSSAEAGISCWDLQSGAERLRYKSCASPRHGLVCVGQRFLASSQLRDSKTSSGSVFYWSWSKVFPFYSVHLNCSTNCLWIFTQLFCFVLQPQVEVKSFPAEQIKPLAANNEGTYIVGGGSSGHIYLWEVTLFIYIYIYMYIHIHTHMCVCVWILVCNMKWTGSFI